MNECEKEEEEGGELDEESGGIEVIGCDYGVHDARIEDRNRIIRVIEGSN